MREMGKGELGFRAGGGGWGGERKKREKWTEMEKTKKREKKR